MTIRKLNKKDIPACADILCAVYNNELWMCRRTRETAAAYLCDISDNAKFVGYAAPEFYKKNGFFDCGHVVFMAKVIPTE